VTVGSWGLRVVTDVIIPITVLLVLPLFFWYKRDRRKSRAETAVAERTVRSKVTTEEVGAMGASVAFVNEAFRLERESKDRRILALEQEVHDVEQRCKEKVDELEEHLRQRDAIIEELRARLEALEGKKGS
jgi:vacuolar-type H+-ATPase subunit I/STV1